MHSAEMKNAWRDEIGRGYYAKYIRQRGKQLRRTGAPRNPAGRSSLAGTSDPDNSISF